MPYCMAMRTSMIVMVLLVSASGCLKTRSQLRQDELPASTAASEKAAASSTSSYAVDELKSEIARLSGRIEELEQAKKSETGDGATKADLKALEARMHELETGQYEIIAQLKRLQAEQSEISENPDILFTQGRAFYNQGRFEEAIDKFNKYLSQKNPAQNAEATFLRGDSFFGVKNYNKAIIDFSKFAENKFPKSKFIPKALYKIGLAFEAKGSPEDARAFYQELVEQYPQSEEARAAKPALATKKKTNSTSRSKPPGKKTANSQTY